MNLFNEETPKLIVNRRAIAAGIAALIGGGAAPAMAKLQQLANVPLTIDPGDIAQFAATDGLFLPNYRKPMVRIIFGNSSTTQWHRYDCGGTRGYDGEWHRAVAIETCAPDKNGNPRYAQLAIG